MKRTIVAVLTVLLGAGAALAQTVDLRVDPDADLRQEVELLKAEVEQLRTQLNEIYQIPQIRQLIAQTKQREAQLALERQPMDVTVDLRDAPTKGQKDAKITILEFSDYQCPACGAYTNQIAPQVNESFIESGTVKLAFFDYPLPRHEQAFKAAEAALCAGDQGQYWEMHDQLFANQQQLMPDDLVNHAEALNLDVEAFETCLDSGKFAEEIRADMEEANKVRLRGTPHFAIGYTVGNGDQVRVVKAMSGASYERLEEVINELLSAEPGD